MVPLLLVCALLSGTMQDEVKKLNKHVEEMLAMVLSIDMQGAPLAQFVEYIEPLFEEKLPFYIDVAEVKKPEDVLITAKAGGSVADVLKASLNPMDLTHKVWNGVIVITTAKGAREFDKAEWCGLNIKELANRKELVAKLNAVHTFEWSPFDPKKAVEVLAKASGVAIDATAIASMKASEENQHLLYPRKTTLFGALACLSRSTGMTFEATKDGKLVARAPKGK